MFTKIKVLTAASTKKQYL